MRVSHDMSADALYIQLSDAPIVRTQELDDGTVVDFDADGAAVGLEILGVSHGWDTAAFLQEVEVDAGLAVHLPSLVRRLASTQVGDEAGRSARPGASSVMVIGQGRASAGASSNNLVAAS